VGAAPECPRVATVLLKTNALRRIKKIFPGTFIVLYRACVLPVLDSGDIVYDNRSVLDANLLENVKNVVKRHPQLPQVHHIRIF